MKAILLIFFALLFSQYNHGHGDRAGGPPKIGSIYGKILNEETGEAIEYASISVYQSESEKLVTGGITDADGYFNIDDIPPGNFMIVIEFIGYENKIMDDISIPSDFITPSINRKIISLEDREKGKNLGSISLKPKAIENLEIRITGDKPLIEFETDKLVYNASHDIVAKTSGSAEDVLKKVPMVQVNQDGEITLRGNSNVKILVDGRENRMGKEVDYIPASLIEKVEVITSPSAKYDPDGMAGIINIVLHEGDEDGFNGSLKLNGRHNDYGSFNEMNGISANGNYRKGKWNLYSSTSIYNKIRAQDGYRKAITTYSPIHIPNDGDVVSGYHYNTNTDNNRNGYLIRLGTDYFYSDDITINAEISYNKHIKNELKIINNYDIETSVLESIKKTSSGESKGNYDVE